MSSDRILAAKLEATATLKADFGNAVKELNLVEKSAKELAQTLSTMLDTTDLQKYWKTEAALIEDVSRAYDSFNEKRRLGDNDGARQAAEELLKASNALQAVAKDASNIQIKGFDLTTIISQVKELKDELGINLSGINSNFNVDSFKAAFNIFNDLENKGVDMARLFERLDASTNFDTLKQTISSLRGEIEGMSENLREAERETENYKSQLESISSGEYIKELEEKAEQLDEVRTRAQNELQTFLSANQFSGEDVLPWGRFSEYFDMISSGSSTATEAIAALKEEMYRSEGVTLQSGGTFDTTKVDSFIERLDELLPKMEELSSVMHNTAEAGVLSKAAGNIGIDLGQAGGLTGVASAGTESVRSLTELLNTLISITPQAEGAMNGIDTSIKDFVDSVSSLASIDLSNLETTRDVFVKLNNLSDFSVTSKSFTTLANSLESLGRIPNLEILPTLSRIDLNKFNTVKVSTTIGNLATYLPTIAEALSGEKIGNLERLATINWENLNNIKVYKGNAEMFSAMTESVQKYTDSLTKALDVQNQIVSGGVQTQVPAGLTNTASIGAEKQEVGDLNREYADHAKLVEAAVLAEAEKSRVSKEVASAVGTEKTVVEEATAAAKEHGEAIAEFNNVIGTGISGSMVPDISGALVAKGVDSGLAEKVANDLKDLNGTISEVRVNWRQFGEDGKHVASVTVKATDGMNAKFSETYSYVQRLNEENKKVWATVESGSVTWKSPSGGTSSSGGATSAANGEAAYLRLLKQVETQLDRTTQQYLKFIGVISDDKIDQSGLDKYIIELQRLENDLKSRQQHTVAEDDSNAFLKLQAQIAECVRVLNEYRSMSEDAGKPRSITEGYEKGMQEVASLQQQLIDGSARWNKSLTENNQFSPVADRLINELNGIIDTMQQGGVYTDYLRERVNQIRTEFKMLGRDASGAMNSGNFVQGTDEWSKALLQIDRAIEDVSRKLVQMGAAKTGKASGAYKDLEAAKDGYERLRGEVEKTTVSTGTFKTRFQQLGSTVSSSAATIVSAGEATKSFGQRVMAVAEKFKFWFSTTRIIMMVIRSIKEMIKTSIELDSKMNQLQIVTKASNQELAAYGEGVAATAKEIGASMTDLIDSATVFSRLGYSLDESSILAKYTSMLKAVGDIDVSTAQDAITAITKAYSDEIKIDDIESVMDRLVEVGNHFPISVAQIAEGMNNASSTLAAAGNTFNESVALLTAANTTIQNISKASTGLRTIVARIRNTKTDLDELGEDMTEAKYDELVQKLTDLNVALTDTAGNYRSTYDIMKDIAAHWKEMDSMQQAALSTALAGNRQTAIFNSIINQFQEASGAMDAMANSAGALEEAYDIYLSSAQAHIDQFKAAYQELGKTIFQTNDMIGAIDLGKWFVEALNSIAQLINSLGGLKTLLFTIAGIVATIKADALLASITQIGAKIKGLGETVYLLGLEFVDAFRKARASGASGLSSVAAGFDAVTASASAAQVAVGAFVAVVAALVIAINAIKKSQSDVVASANDAYNSAVQTGQESKKIYDLYAAYKDAKRSIDDNIESKKKLKQATLELANALGYEEGAVEDNTGAFDENTISDLKSLVGDLESDAIKAENALTGMTVERLRLWKEMYAISGVVPGEILGGVDKDAVRKYNELSQSDQAKQYIEAYDSLVRKRNEMSDAIRNGEEVDSSLYEDIVDTVDHYESVVNNLKNIYSELADAQGRLTNSENLRDLEILAEEYNNLVNGNVDYNKRPFISPDVMRQAGWTDFSGAAATTYTQGVTIGEGEYLYTIDITPILEDGTVLTPAALDDYISKLVTDNGVKGLLESDESKLVVNVQQGAYDKGYWDPLENKLQEIKDKHYELADALGFVEEGFGKVSGSTAKVGIDFDAITDSVKKLSDAYKLIGTAEKEMEDGGLSADTIKALADANADYLDYLYEEDGVIKLNTDAWREYIRTKAMDNVNNLEEERKALLDQREVIRGNIRTLEERERKGEHTGALADSLKKERKALKDVETALVENGIQIGIYTDQYNRATDAVEDHIAALNDLQSAIKNVSDKSKGLETLGKIFEDVKNGGDFDYSSLISDDFVNAFSQYGEAYENFMNAIVDSPADIDACKEAFEDLATEYVYGSGILDGLTESNKNVVTAMLEHLGVANADIIVTEELARQKEKVRLESLGVANMTYAEINAMAHEAGAAMSTKQALLELARQKLLTNKNTIKTSADIQNLYDLAKAAGATVATLGNLAKAKVLMDELNSINPIGKDGMLDVEAMKRAAYIRKQIERLLSEKYEYKPPAEFTGGNAGYDGGGGSGGGGEGGSGGSSSKGESWFEKQYKLHNHLRKMEQESDKTYFSWLDGAFKKAYKEGIISLDDYRKYEEEVFEGLRALFEDFLNDKEHKIWLLGNDTADKRDINKIVAYYKELMKAVANESKRARAAGLTEEDDYIQELQKKYREYFEALSEARSSWFNELMDLRQFRIDKLVEHNGDPYKIVKLYRSMAEEIQKEVQWYLANGFTVADDVVRDLIRQLWDVADNIVSAANSAVDGIQNVYTTLTNAAKEWADTGYLSVDSLQSILELGPKYLAYLYDENGQLRINEEALQKILALRTEELATDNAMVYAKRILAAAERADGEELRALTVIDAAKTASTWDMVYATLALAEATGVANGVDKEYFEKAREYIDKMRDLTQKTIDTIAESYKTLDDDYISQADAMDAIIGYTKELIKFETEQQIQALKDELDAYKKIVDAKKESLRISKEQDKHDRDMADKIASIADLQAKIDQLALDDSREARAQRAKLEAELAEKQKDLADSQSDYAYDQQIAALDKSYEAFEAEKNAEIKVLEEMYRSEEALYRAAIERIKNGWDDLYQQLIDWNTGYGSVLNDTITAAWEQAAAAVERYGSILAALREYEGIKSLIQIDERGSELHWGSGTSVSGSGQNRAIDIGEYLSQKLGSNVNLNGISTSYKPLGIYSGGVAANLAGLPITVGEASINTNVTVEINHSGPYSGEDAGKFGRLIADSTIERINDAFSRRGITTLGRALLKA